MVGDTEVSDEKSFSYLSLYSSLLRLIKRVSTGLNIFSGGVKRSAAKDGVYQTGRITNVILILLSFDVGNELIVLVMKAFRCTCRSNQGLTDCLLFDIANL